MRKSEASERSVATHSSAGTEIDAQQPINDELSLNKVWWLLEIIPTSYTYQDGSGRWHNKWGYVASSFYFVFCFRLSVLTLDGG